MRNKNASITSTVSTGSTVLARPIPELALLKSEVDCEAQPVNVLGLLRILSLIYHGILK